MSRRPLSLIVVAIASVVVSACAASSTAPRGDDTATARAPIVTAGSYDVAPTDTAGRIVTAGSY